MTEHPPQTKPILVTGGTGKTGRRVAERLEARGVPVRIGSRYGEPPFDWDDRSTWTPALKGTGSVYVSHYLDALPGAAETIGSFAELAVRSARRIWCCFPAAASPRPTSPSRPCATPAQS